MPTHYYYRIFRLLWVLSGGTCLISSPLSAQDILTHFRFSNFDGASAELELVVPKADYDSTIVDWRSYLTHRSSDSTENYLNFVKGLFEDNKGRLKFVFDVFDQALSSVSDEYLLNTLITFVQSLPYRVPPILYHGKDINDLLPPVATLVEGYGDCDTKSVLFACIAAHKFDVIFLLGPRHAFIGVKGEPGANQEYVEVLGTKYILCEMTGVWPLGTLPPTSRNDINSGQYICIQLK